MHIQNLVHLWFIQNPGVFLSFIWRIIVIIIIIIIIIISFYSTHTLYMVLRSNVIFTQYSHTHSNIEITFFYLIVAIRWQYRHAILIFFCVATQKLLH